MSVGGLPPVSGKQGVQGFLAIGSRNHGILVAQSLGMTGTWTRSPSFSLDVNAKRRLQDIFSAIPAIPVPTKRIEVAS